MMQMERSGSNGLVDSGKPVKLLAVIVLAVGQAFIEHPVAITGRRNHVGVLAVKLGGAGIDDRINSAQILKRNAEPADIGNVIEQFSTILAQRSILPHELHRPAVRPCIGKDERGRVRRPVLIHGLFKKQWPRHWIDGQSERRIDRIDTLAKSPASLPPLADLKSLEFVMKLPGDKPGIPVFGRQSRDTDVGKVREAVEDDLVVRKFVAVSVDTVRVVVFRIHKGTDDRRNRF